MAEFPNRASIFLFLILFSTAYGKPAQIYVSPKGSTTAAGTLEKPSTIERAIELTNGKKTKEIILLDGIYELTETLLINDDPRRKNPLVIRALNEGKAIISGGIVLTANLDDNERVKTFPKEDKRQLHSSRDLFVGDIRAIRARSITYSSWDNKFSAIPGLSKENKDKTDTDIEIKTGLYIKDHSGRTPPLQTWKNPEDLEFVFRCAWWEKRCGVNSIENNKITFSEPGWNTLNTPWANEGISRLNSQMPKTTHIEGAIELLDSPGEWHNGRTAIHLIPPKNVDLTTNEVRLAHLETLIRLDSTSNISFKGITFAHTTWHAPINKDGFNEGQANFEQTGNTGRPTEAVGIYNSSHISFEDCTFKNLGGWGLGIFEASKHVTVSKCSFIDTAGNGLVIGATSDEEALEESKQVSDVTISDSWVHNPASVYKGGVGIFVGHASRTKIIRNEVCHAPYTAISIGWGWNRFDSTNITTHKNQIEENHIHHYLYNMYDGGGIYTLGPQSNAERGMKSGSTITRNIIRNQGGIGNIIYSDGGSRWITISNNTTFNNLKELEYYYEQKAMYVPDWGGCSPYGDLMFTGNQLGNVEMRSPNFRCAPSDLEPWNPSFSLPTNTIYSNNEFSTEGILPGEILKISKARHQTIQEDSIHAIRSVSTTITSIDSAPLTFTLGSDSKVRIESTPSTINQFVLQSQTQATSWNGESKTLFLKAGVYRLLFKKDIDPPPLHSPISIRIGSNNATITSISAPTSEIEIDTQNTAPIRYLIHSLHPGSGELILESKSNERLAENSSWIEDSHHWQILRSFIDTQTPLPETNTRAILSNLPSGHFKIKQTAPAPSPLLTITAATSQSE